MASKADVREVRRRQVERLVDSGMDVAQWCELNRVGKAALYDWLKEFRDSDPDVFGGYDIAHAGDGRRNWYEHVRKAIHASKAIEKAPEAVMTAAKAPSPAFAVVDAASLAEPCRAQPTPAASAITVRMRGVAVDVPAGSAEADIASVLAAVASL